ncbi:MAG: DUF2125 domain-containing protein [Paracoccus sp. (in: a-proteobacteria)]|uniref:DUF2125 domain-containing protein n=1 Tax=Paracoccus sp. TaxID=267 RepID=UPI0026DF39AB|nr:DUF2125 domain-containing protein [Paracoccus sp. (in: a-proteobacteria)]MDO5631868.1 DUF2125 domain-containing protein [Paracoccus sp. (in: a-proteobacteria)]
MIRLLSTSAAALMIAAAPVFAEVTPAQVWEALVQNYRESGLTLTEGSRDQAGDTLTISNVTIDADTMMPAPVDGAEAAVTFALQIPRVVLTTTGDGNVRTVFEGDWTGAINAPDPEGEPGTPMTLTIAMPGNEMVTSGSPEAMNHTLNYPEMNGTITLRDPNGTEVPVNFTVTDTKGTYNTTGTAGTGTQTDYDLTSAGATISIDSAIPGEDGQPGGHVKADLALKEMTGTGTMNMPAGDHDMSANGMNAALRAGAELTADMTFAGYDGTADFSGQDEDGNDQSGNISFTAGKGGLAVSMNNQAISYSGNAESASVDMTVNTMPFPMSYAVGPQSFDVKLPVMASDQAQPFSVKYALEDLTLGDAIWGLFDPTAQLPRDPASLTVDVSGDLLVTRDLMDPEFEQRMIAATTPQGDATELSAEQLAELEALQDEAVPFQPVKLALNQIALRAIGATADVKGELTAAPDGDFSQPVGTIDGSFTGVNTLLDRLASLGLIPQEQVAGARMMLMIFAKPVAGQEDALETHIEMREDGSVFANGQQMR